MNWVQIVILAISISVFGVIIYFVSKAFASTCPPGTQYDTTLKECVPSCADDQILDRTSLKCVQACYDSNGLKQAVPQGEERLENGDCAQSCDTGQNRCLQTYLKSKACFDPNTSVCMKDGSGPCPTKPINRYCVVDGKETCCPLYCTGNTCTNCPNQMCGSTCCSDPTETCFTESNGTKVCCTKDKWVPSSVDPNLMQCCQSATCGGVCCQDGEQCVGNKCVKSCGSTTCDPSTQFCYTAGPLSKCIDRSTCGWTLPQVNPQAVLGQTNPDNPNAYPVCQAQDGSLWLTTAGGSNNSKWATSSCDITDSTNTGINCISSDSTSLLCDGKNSCQDVLNFKGISAVNNYTVSNQSGTNRCAGQLDCSRLLLSPTDTRLASICNDIGGGRCMTAPNGSYTGQLCPPNFVYKDGKCNCTGGKGDKCQFTRAITCNNHGEPNSDLAPTCDCDAGYCTAFDNKTCATPIGWQPKRDGTGIEPFNLFTHVYGSAYSIDTSYIPQSKEDIPPLLLVLLPGITVRNNPSNIQFLTNNDHTKPFLTLFGCPAPATYYYNEVASGLFPISFILDLDDTSLPSNQFYHIEVLMPKSGTGMMDFNLPDPNNQVYINNSIIRIGNISTLFIGMGVGAPPS